MKKKKLFNFNLCQLDFFVFADIPLHTVCHTYYCFFTWFVYIAMVTFVSFSSYSPAVC